MASRPPKYNDRREEPPRPRERQNEYYLPIEGISREVIQADICRYLGNDALVRVGDYNEMIADLKADSARWEKERYVNEQQGYASGSPVPVRDPDMDRSPDVVTVPYGNSQTHSDRQTAGPSNSPMPQAPMPTRDMRDPRDISMRDVPMRDPRDIRDQSLPSYAQGYQPHNPASMDAAYGAVPPNYPGAQGQFPVSQGYPPQQSQYGYSQPPAGYGQVAPSRGPTDSPTQQESMQMYTTSTMAPRQEGYMNPQTHAGLQPRYTPNMDSNSPQQAFTETPDQQMYFATSASSGVQSYPVMAPAYGASPSSFDPRGEPRYVENGGFAAEPPNRVRHSESREGPPRRDDPRRRR
ncbi:MAG: hypothetical protein M1834_003144 [Cirrosporium novae-zelandiae]|nr:MAG: hypothetical protein M1834_003144 [Cirrosporium novae-zelandiae]